MDETTHDSLPKSIPITTIIDESKTPTGTFPELFHYLRHKFDKLLSVPALGLVKCITLRPLLTKGVCVFCIFQGITQTLVTLSLMIFDKKIHMKRILKYYFTQEATELILR